MSGAGVIGSVVAAILAFLLGNRIFPFVPDSELTDSELQIRYSFVAPGRC